MARNRLRVMKKANWTPDAMKAAIKAKKKVGKNLSETAAITTFRDELQAVGTKTSFTNVGSYCFVHNGPQSIDYV